MCSIVIINHHYKGFPLVIAANRDEDYSRSSSGVQLLAKEPHVIVGGKDEEKGGSWLAVNKHSLFATVTNQDTGTDDMISWGSSTDRASSGSMYTFYDALSGEHRTICQRCSYRNSTYAKFCISCGEGRELSIPKKPEKQILSRGSVVMDAMKCSSLKDMLAFVEGLDPARYKGFNLVFGNQEAVFLAHSYILDSMLIKEIPTGVSLVTSDLNFAGIDPRSQMIHKTYDAVVDEPWEDYYKSLKKTLASSKQGFKIAFSKKKPQGHCTKSSSILTFSESGLARYKFHDRTVVRPKRKEGDPFIPRYRDYIDLWRDPLTFTDKSSSKEEENESEEEEKSGPSGPLETSEIKSLIMKLKRQEAKKSLKDMKSRFYFDEDPSGPFRDDE